MKNIPFCDIEITGGLWQQKQTLCKNVTLDAVYDRFKETGRISTMNCKAQKITPHCYWASDVFKCIEGAVPYK